ncbi:MAG: aspartate kinase [Defluviitaleaceae bacterium]|nr:aspartate kinase [Defluviitaleaceae bacterium]MCL2240226.1 aspartate kinase [Defluviitaleaceae bacterium]
MLIVQKYGGTSVADAGCIMRVAERIVQSHRAGHKMVVVLSAQGDTTDILTAKAREIAPDPSKRELDMLLVTGEQQAVALMAMAIHKLGAPALSMNAVQVGIEATSLYGNARIRRIRPERITRALELNSIVIVAGFQGVNRYGDMTTLGRGASDTTAVALAAVLGADVCEIYSDVSGIFTADPRIVPVARKLPCISYDEMLELASMGAQVLHNRAVEMAKRHRVKLVLRSSSRFDDEGTEIREESTMEKLLFSGLAVDRDVARISVMGLVDRPGLAYHVFSLLAKEKISVDIILQTAGNGQTKDISFTVAHEHLDAALKVLETNREQIGFDMTTYDTQVAKLSVIGAGMTTNYGVASSMFEALYDCGVNIHLISSSEIKITVLIDENAADRAARAIHEKFTQLMQD